MSRQTVGEDKGSCDRLKRELRARSDRCEMTNDGLEYTALVFRNGKKKAVMQNS